MISTWHIGSCLDFVIRESPDLLAMGLEQIISLCPFFFFFPVLKIEFPGGSDSKVSAYNAGDLGLIPGLGRSPGEGNGNPLHTPAWKIPWTEQHGRLLLSLGSQRVGHDWVTSLTQRQTALTLHGFYEVWIQSIKGWHEAWQKVRDRRQSGKRWTPAS